MSATYWLLFYDVVADDVDALVTSWRVRAWTVVVGADDDLDG